MRRNIVENKDCDIESYIHLSGMPLEVYEVIKKVLNKGWDILDLYSITDSFYVPTDIIDYLIKIRRIDTPMIFLNKMTDEQLSKCLRLYNSHIIYGSLDGKEDSEILIEGLTRQTVDIAVIQKAILKNNNLFTQLYDSPSIKKIFPEPSKVIDKICRTYSAKEENVQKMITSILMREPFQPSQIDKIIKKFVAPANKLPLNERHKFLPYELRKALIFGQPLDVKQLAKIGIKKEYFWALCKKNGDSIGALLNSFMGRPMKNAKLSPMIVGANMGDDLIERCLKSKNDKVTGWLAMVGPENILPLLLNRGPITTAAITARFKNDDSVKTRMDIADTIFSIWEITN